MGLSTDMFFHSSEYWDAIHIRPNITKKAPNLLCSTTKRQWFQATRKGAHAQVWLCCLPPTSLSSIAQVQGAQGRGLKDGERWHSLSCISNNLRDK